MTRQDREEDPLPAAARAPSARAGGDVMSGHESLGRRLRGGRHGLGRLRLAAPHRAIDGPKRDRHDPGLLTSPQYELLLRRHASVALEAKDVFSGVGLHRPAVEHRRERLAIEGDRYGGQIVPLFVLGAKDDRGRVLIQLA